MIATSLLESLAQRLPVIIFVLIFVVQIGRGIWRAYKAKQPPPAMKPDELEAQRRAREIQEAIRRKRADRGAAPEPVARQLPPSPRPTPETTQLPEPPGGPLRRIFEELQREMSPPSPTPAPPPLPPVVVEHREPELQRQRKLAEELRSLEQARAQTARRAAYRASETAAVAQMEPALRTVARGELLDDLREPESLRRAFVLREVLGTPVGLR